MNNICLFCSYFNESKWCCRNCKSQNIYSLSSEEWKEKKLEYLELININKANFQALKVRCKDAYYSLVGYPYQSVNNIFEIWKWVNQEIVCSNKSW